MKLEPIALVAHLSDTAPPKSTRIFLAAANEVQKMYKGKQTNLLPFTKEDVAYNKSSLDVAPRQRFH